MSTRGNNPIIESRASYGCPYADYLLYFLKTKQASGVSGLDRRSLEARHRATAPPLLPPRTAASTSQPLPIPQRESHRPCRGTICARKVNPS